MKNLVEENVGPGPAPHLSASIPTGEPQSAAAAGSYVTLPSDFPAITVTTPADNVAPGLLFVSAFTSTAFGKGQRMSHLLVLDNSGRRLLSA